MYLNQFTNTKNSVQALSLHHDKRLQWIHVRVKPKIPSNSFSSTKMTWDILFHTLSASKMSSTRCIIQKRKKKEKKRTCKGRVKWICENRSEEPCANRAHGNDGKKTSFGRCLLAATYGYTLLSSSCCYLLEHPEQKGKEKERKEACTLGSKRQI